MSELWISTNTAATLLNCTPQHVRSLCKKAVYRTRVINSNAGRGGVSYEIDLYSMPETAQAKFFRDNSHQSAIPETAPQGVTTNKAEQSEPASPAALTSYNREIYEKNIEIVEYFKDLKGKAIESALNQWNFDHNDQKPLTKRTLYRLLQTYRENGSIALAGHYGKRQGASLIKDEWFFGAFLKVYAAQGTTTSISACRQVARGYAIKNGQIEAADQFPSVEAFRRKLKTLPPQVLAMYREDLDFYKRNHSYSINIDPDSIQCGQIFVADHAKFDFFVRTADNRLVRPWISALCDYKSRMIVGYDLFLDDPNGNNIIVAMKRSFQNYGIPKMLLFDNGKDYRRKDIGGGRPCRTSDLISDYAPTITHFLGIELHFAIPYNSQTKPIERVFGIFRNYFDKFMPGYAGSDGKKRPDKTKAIELKMAKAIRQGDEETPEKLPVLKFDEWQARVKEFIEVYNYRVFTEGKHAGLSPVGIWNQDAPVMRAPKTDDLAILCAASGEAVRITRNTLRDTRTGERYWASWMRQYDGSEKRFFLRIDPENLETAYCFFADWNDEKERYDLGSFIDTAKRQPSLPLYDNSEEARKALAEQMEIKNGLLRYAKNELKQAVGDPFTPEETLEYMKISVMADHNAACEAKGISPDAPAAPVENQLTRFSSVAKEVKVNEMQGTDHPAFKNKGVKVKRYQQSTQKEEEPKIIRFKRYVTDHAEDENE